MALAKPMYFVARAVLVTCIFLPWTTAEAQTCAPGTQPYLGACFGSCPPGSSRTAACTCQSGAVDTNCARYGTSRPPVPSCTNSEFYGGLCYRNCPAGYQRTAACTCVRGASIITDCARYGAIGAPTYRCPSGTDAHGGLCYSSACPNGSRRTAACTCDSLQIMTDCPRYGHIYGADPRVFRKPSPDSSLSCTEVCGNAKADYGDFGVCVGARLQSGPSTGVMVACDEAPRSGIAEACYCSRRDPPTLPYGAFEKAGNNGTVSCNAYCENAHDNWGQYGTCRGGNVIAGPLKGSELSCDRHLPSLGNVVCFCKPGPKSLPRAVLPNWESNVSNSPSSCSDICHGHTPYGDCVGSEVVGGNYIGRPLGCDEVLDRGSTIRCICRPGTPPPPPQFSTPFDLGCCATLVAAEINAGWLSTLASYGCTSEKQRVFRARVENVPAGKSAQEMCRGGQVQKATVQGKEMAPTICNNDIAFFVVDDSACKATQSPPPACDPVKAGTQTFCVYIGTPPGYVTKSTWYQYGCKEQVKVAIQNQCSNCRVVDGVCEEKCGDGAHDFGEECDTGGATASCTAECKETTPGRDEIAPLVSSNRTSLAPGTGFLFGPKFIQVVSNGARDIWWNGIELVPADKAYLVGTRDSLAGLDAPDPNQLKKIIVTPRLKDVVVVRLPGASAGYVALRVTSVGTSDRRVVFDWIRIP